MDFPLIILLLILFMSNLNAQILDGLEVASHDYRYQVLIFTNDQVCSGAIIDEWYVITAAHCFDIGDSDEILVIAGMTGFNDATKIVKKVSEVHIHPDYMPGVVSGTGDSMTHRPREMGNDIAVVKLHIALKLGDSIRKIELPTENITYCRFCFLAGWGPYNKEEGKQLSKVLRWTTMAIRTPEFCEAVGVTHEAKEFCADDPLLTGTAAQTDSGGPLRCGDKLTGIVSAGWAKPEIPAIFTNVYEHLDFINEIITPQKVSVPQIIIIK